MPLSNIPPNANQLGRPPRPIRLDNPVVLKGLTDPGLTNRLRAALEQGNPADMEAMKELIVDVRQFRRALNGDRQRIGEYMGDDRYPTEAMPFAPRETHRPDREPGTPAHKAMRTIVENIDADHITEGLQQRMTTDAARPPDPPSLRDQVSAAFTAHTGIEE